VTPELWQRVNEIFHAALAFDPAQRDDYVRTHTGYDLELLREVQSLLDSHGVQTVTWIFPSGPSRPS